MEKSSIAEIIRKRRTIHQFRPQQRPPQEEIMAAIEHAIWAPNHYKTEPWKFYLIGDDTKEKICQLNAELVRNKHSDKAADIKLKRWREIPGWLLLSCNKSDDETRAREDFASCCCVAQNLMLYLWSIDIGVKWTTGEVTREQKFFEIMDIDNSRESVVGLFWYGYADEIPQMSRPSLEQIVIELP